MKGTFCEIPLEKSLLFSIFFSPPFPVPNLQSTPWTRKGVTACPGQKISVSVSLCSSHTCSPIMHESWNLSNSAIKSKPYRTKISYFPFFLPLCVTFLGPARVFCADEVLTEGARKASLRKHSSATAEAQTKRKAQALTPQSIPKAEAYQKVQTSKPNRIYKSEMTWFFKNA